MIQYWSWRSKKSCLNPSSVVAGRSATGHPHLNFWCADSEVGVLEYRMLWDVSLDGGTTSTAAAQTKRLCIVLDSYINCLTPGITISIPMRNHFVLPNIYTSCLAFHGLTFIDHSEMAVIYDTMT
jgi:hypothetical protein